MTLTAELGASIHIEEKQLMGMVDARELVAFLGDGPRVPPMTAVEELSLWDDMLAYDASRVRRTYVETLTRRISFLFSLPHSGLQILASGLKTHPLLSV